MNTKLPCMPRALCAGLLVFLCTAAGAAEADAAMGMYIEGGRASHSEGATNALTLGVVLPWTGYPANAGGALSFYGDLFVSEWRAPAYSGNGDNNFTQIGAIATWRYRFDQGSSPWFAEAGIGATLFNHLYQRGSRQFSTAFQFTEVAGVGRSFGSRNEHELSVRYQHVSNGGIKKPNPGENFVQLRYLYRF